MSDEQSIKVYVRVGVVFNDDGRMMPRFICWEDGVKYRIDRVAEISQAVAQRCGGQGDRYTILIDGKQSYLFFERSCSLTGNNIGRWFVERKIS